MDDEAPVVHYDAQAGTLRVRLAGGEEISVTGLAADVPFWRGSEGEPPRGPMWLSAQQADVLGKMIDYILQKVKISAPSRQALEELSPQMAQLREELEEAAASARRPGAEPLDEEDYS